MKDISFSSHLRAVMTPPDINNKKLTDLGSFDPGQGNGTPGKSFGEFLNDYMESVNQDQKMSANAATDLASGKTKNIHETMIISEKADLSFRMMVQVRNKVLEAYQEVMRMQV